MAKWVIRRTLDGKAASEAMLCAEWLPILDGTGVRSVDDFIEQLLTNGEHVEDGMDRRAVKRGEELVGFIDITDWRP
jgi:hypothetical protein